MNKDFETEIMIIVNITTKVTIPKSVWSLDIAYTIYVRGVGGGGGGGGVMSRFTC